MCLGIPHPDGTGKTTRPLVFEFLFFVLVPGFLWRRRARWRRRRRRGIRCRSYSRLSERARMGSVERVQGQLSFRSRRHSSHPLMINAVVILEAVAVVHLGA